MTYSTKRLSDVCVVDWGNTELTKTAYVSDGEFLAVSAAGCDGRIGHAEHDVGTVVLAAIGSVGNIFMPEEPFTAIKNTITLTPKEGEATGKYIFHALTHFQLPHRGASQPFISKGDTEGFFIPIPPLLEQQRIVSKLDAAFAALAEAQANVERNRANARELFESYLNGVFEDAAKNAEVASLGDRVDFQGGNQPPKSEFIYEPRDGYVRFLQIRDFKRDDKVTFIPVSKKNRTCEAHDIMLGRYGASVGNVLTGRAGAYNVALIKTVPAEVLHREYFYYYLLSKFFQAPLLSVAARSAQDGFSKEDIHHFQLPIPDLGKQKAIASNLATVKQKADELEATYQQKLTELEGLKKGLLGAAFRGEL